MKHPASQGHKGYFLVEIRLSTSGRVLRYCSAPNDITISTQSGSTYKYQSGLNNIRYTESYEPSNSLSVELFSPDNVIGGWAYLFSTGETLENSSAIVKRWYETQELERADVILRGKISDIKWGDKDQPLSCKISRKLRGSGMIPKNSQRVSYATWPKDTDSRIIEESRGFVYPVCFGYPGWDPEFILGFRPVVPATYAQETIPDPIDTVENQISDAFLEPIIFAGHRVDATDVYLVNYSMWVEDGDDFITSTPTDPPTNWDLRPVKTTKDNIGNLVSYVNLDPGDSYPDIPVSPDGQEWRIAFTESNGGGISDNGKVIRGAGDVIKWLLSKTNIPVDLAAMDRSNIFLNDYKLDFVINERADIIDFINQQIEPIIPMNYSETNIGSYYRPVKLQATEEDSIKTLIEGQNVVRSSLVTSDTDIYNDITVKYAWDGERYVKTATISANQIREEIDEVEATYFPNPGVIVTDYVNKWRDIDPDVLPHFYAKVSQDTYGVRSREIETRVVWDKNTAYKIAVDQILKSALPWRTIEVEGSQELDILEINDIVTYTDSDLFLENEVAIIREKQIRADNVSLTISIIPNPTEIKNRRTK